VKRTLFVLAIVVPAGALIGLLLDSASEMFGAAPSLARRERSAVNGAAPSSRPTAIALSEGSGSELFLERGDEATIAGAAIKYARSYAAASSYANAGTGVILAKDPVVILNAAPRSEHEVARLLTINTNVGSREARRLLEAAFGSRTGIRSREARIEGEADLSRISRVQFTGDVEAVMVDPEVPGAALQLTTQRLDVDFDGRDVVMVSTDLPLSIERRAGDLTLTARGLELRLREERVRLLHDVHVTGRLSARLPADPPFTFSTPGPVDVAFGRRDGKAGSFALAGTRASASGGVKFDEGDLRGSAKDATLTLGKSAGVETLELIGDVVLANADGEARGRRLFVAPSAAKRTESKAAGEPLFATLEGEPITLRPHPGAALFPAQLGDDATLTTSGTLTITAVVDGPLGRGRKIAIGQSLLLKGTTGELAAKRALIWVPSEPNPRVQYHVILRGVEAHDAETTVEAADVDLAREGLGGDAVDRVTLSGRYVIVHRPKPRPAKPGQGPAPAPGGPESRRDVPHLGGGPVRLTGSGTFDLRSPAALDRPMIVDIAKAFRAESLDPGGGKAPRAILDADSARLELVADGPAKAPGAATPRTLAAFSAGGKVRIELPGKARASGQRLTYDARLRQVLLRGGTAPNDLARVDRTETESKDWLRAATISFHEDLLQIVATTDVEAEIALRPLPWAGIPSPPRGHTVPSTVRAHRLVVDLDAERYRRGEVAPTEVRGEVNLKVTQPERTLTADLATFDVARQTGMVRGAPVRYAVIRMVDGAALGEGIVCPALTLDGDRIVVEGPAEALFHARRGLGLAQADEDSRKHAAEPLQPVKLTLARRGVLVEEAIVAEGRVSLEQGEIQKDGTTASADTAMIFFARAPGDETRPTRPTQRELGLLVLHGSAKYRTFEFDAAADVMKVNRLTKHASLFNERPAKVVLIMKRRVHEADVYNGVSRLDVDFTDPKGPAVTAFDHDVEVAPASRTSQ
jgi:hypothetical protein